MPHFAAGLRINAKAGGDLTVRTELTQQVALSKGTVLASGAIVDPATPGVGIGNYSGYSISTNGVDFGPAMWPAQTIEAHQDNQLVIYYKNELVGVKYSDFNILADQTLMMNGHAKTGNELTDPYTGDIPMVVHLMEVKCHQTRRRAQAWFTRALDYWDLHLRICISNITI
jgi:hypothetical protein